ncbi:hypothetical protein AAVH_18228 [Aphelenchoides avenae]|nr:hypothetical protein AAVH_37869 [Aphelenchus avenae]KAH7714409.1 hypothetical protein AAVH_18228 [Aphelenchus avenae]
MTLLLHVFWCVVLADLVYGNPYGEKFTVFKQVNGRVFGYKPRTACIVQQSADGIHASIRNIDTVERSADVIVHKESGACVDACFKYQGTSVLWMRCANVLLKGADVIRLPFTDYDMARYDQAEGTIYLVSGTSLKLYHFADILEDTGSAAPCWTTTLSEPASDLMIVGGYVFGVRNRSVMRLDVDRRWVPVQPIDQDTFNFQLFMQQEPSSGGRVAEKIPSIIAYCLEIGAVLFLAYCLRYRLSYRAGRLEATPPQGPVESPVVFKS